ncbi:hypothetical protein BCON_0001g00100 [Botryotinia convoluta]|uniref:Uncharacterized protein n=1 Tax=Botryotinia convoluta TaxID=54673 RepID=A0A4Z1IWE7_9HELO|nr:hypothetical protein BCON_0001g00100 [Botryotinia convoluta]
MFHTRQATDRRDKVYALLGMSSGDPEKAGLQPNYETSWEDVFQQVVNFILGKDITVSTSSQRAAIQCKGLIFGQVSSVRIDDGQHVSIKSRLSDWDLSDTTEWTLQASAKPIQEHDIICLLYGASKPTIIRLCHDHFIVIVIAATPLNVLTHERLLEARSGYMAAFEKGPLLRPIGEGGRTLLSFAAGEGHEDVIKLLLGKVDPEIKDGIYEQTPLSFAAENEHQAIVKLLLATGHESVVKLLLATGQVEADSKGSFGKKPLSLAAEKGHEAVVKLILATGQVEINSKDDFDRTALFYATRNGHAAIAKLLKN